jgi:hypothetical protein
MTTQGTLTTFLSLTLTVLVSAVVWMTLLAGLIQLVRQTIHRLHVALPAWQTPASKSARYPATVAVEEQRKAV